MGRWGSAEEIAQSVVYRASERSAFMTGHALVIDGAESLQPPAPCQADQPVLLGLVAELHSEPELQARGWQQRIDIEELIFAERWGQRR